MIALTKASTGLPAEWVTGFLAFAFIVGPCVWGVAWLVREWIAIGRQKEEERKDLG